VVLFETFRIVNGGFVEAEVGQKIDDELFKTTVRLPKGSEPPKHSAGTEIRIKDALFVEGRLIERNQ